jgi:hypothetical protein
MKRALVTLLVAGLLAVSAAAVEVRLNDGTVLEATSYTVTGSYVMLELADGRQVAYDVVDVDLDALRAQEQTSDAAAPEQPQEPTLSQGRRLQAPPADGEQAVGPAITDHDVKHVRGSAAAAAEEEGEGAQPASGPPAGYNQGGGVVINNLRVTPQGSDRWLVEGEVINRMPDPVIDVRVQLQTIAGPGETPWSGEVPVASLLAPDGRGTFSHSFQADKPEGKVQPDVRASVIWMQQQQREAPPPAAQRAPRQPGPIPTPAV